MSTEVFWNEAKPPKSEGEHQAAGWLASIARTVGITSVTDANRSEWIWRFAFMQEMRGRRFGGAHGYERDIGRLDVVLQRFISATLKGRVVDQNREEFIEDFMRTSIDAAREQADAAAEQDHADAIA